MLSKWLDMLQSVRQGRVLGAWLFIIIFNDLAIQIQNYINIPRTAGIKCGPVIQADDVAVIAIHPNHLNDMIKICIDYCKLWRLVINFCKTNVMVLGERK